MDILEPILEALGQFVQTLYGQLVNIPLDNPLSYVYVVMNWLLLLVFGA